MSMQTNKTRTLRQALSAMLLGLVATLAVAQANLEANTPAISQLKSAMQARYAQLEPLLTSGAVGLSRDGGVSLRDANAVPLSARQSANSLVAAENADRAALYREIARANGKPEWESEIRSTFAQRWIDKAPGGWWVQDARGNWARK